MLFFGFIIVLFWKGEMGAISKETIMEKTEYVSDVEVEKKRLSGENVNRSPNGEQLKTTDNVDNSVDNLA